MWTQLEDTIYELANMSSPDSKFPGNVILVFPASGMVRNRFLQFISHSAYGILLQQPELAKLVNRQFLETSYEEENTRLSIEKTEVLTSSATQSYSLGQIIKLLAFVI